jgi:hypothetical protein
MGKASWTKTAATEAAGVEEAAAACSGGRGIPNSGHHAAAPIYKVYLTRGITEDFEFAIQKP